MSGIWHGFRRLLGLHRRDRSTNHDAIYSELEQQIMSEGSRHARASENAVRASLDDIDRTQATRAAIDDLMRRFDKRRGHA